MKRFIRNLRRDYKGKALGIWRVLTSDYFVVLNANDGSRKVQMCLNVDYNSFCNMVNTADGVIEKTQADRRIMAQVNEALNNKKAL